MQTSESHEPSLKHRFFRAFTIRRWKTTFEVDKEKKAFDLNIINKHSKYDIRNGNFKFCFNLQTFLHQICIFNFPVMRSGIGRWFYAVFFYQISVSTLASASQFHKLSFRFGFQALHGTVSLKSIFKILLNSDFGLNNFHQIQSSHCRLSFILSLW